jgi:hypothetical protein
MDSEQEVALWSLRNAYLKAVCSDRYDYDQQRWLAPMGSLIEALDHGVGAMADHPDLAVEHAWDWIDTIEQHHHQQQQQYIGVKPPGEKHPAKYHKTVKPMYKQKNGKQQMTKHHPQNPDGHYQKGNGKWKKEEQPDGMIKLSNHKETTTNSGGVNVGQHKKELEAKHGSAPAPKPVPHKTPEPQGVGQFRSAGGKQIPTAGGKGGAAVEPKQRPNRPPPPTPPPQPPPLPPRKPTNVPAPMKKKPTTTAQPPPPPGPTPSGQRPPPPQFEPRPEFGAGGGTTNNTYNVKVKAKGTATATSGGGGGGGETKSKSKTKGSGKANKSSSSSSGSGEEGPVSKPKEKKPKEKKAESGSGSGSGSGSDLRRRTR